MSTTASTSTTTAWRAQKGTRVRYAVYGMTGVGTIAQVLRASLKTDKDTAGAGLFLIQDAKTGMQVHATSAQIETLRR